MAEIFDGAPEFVDLTVVEETALSHGVAGDACIVGIAERPSERKFAGTPTLTLEQWAGLAADALADAGIDARDVDGVACGGDVAEASLFLPATIAEYCGWSVNFAERADLGGASAVGLAWRAAAAIELGICEVVVCATVGQPRPPSPIPRPPNGRADLRRVEHGVGLTPGRVRRSLRQRGAELRLRDVRAALPRPLRMGRAVARQDRLRPTGRARARTRPPRSTGNRSPSTTCWRRASSPRRCTCSRSSCRARAAPRSS